MVNGTTEAKALRGAVVCISSFIYLHISASVHVWGLLYKTYDSENLKSSSSCCYTKKDLCLFSSLFIKQLLRSWVRLSTRGTCRWKNKNRQPFVLMFYCDVNTRVGAMSCFRQSVFVHGAGVHSCQQRLFFSFLLQRCSHILALS